MKLERLFEKAHYPTARSTALLVKGEIDAVAARKKGVAVYWPDPRWLETDEFRARVAYANERGLLVVLDVRRMFVVRQEELWRIPAIRALPWTGDDIIRSTLFGYTPQQIRAWIAEERWWRPEGRGGDVYYTLLTDTQRADVASFGNKVVREPMGLEIFEAGVPIRRDAFGRIPRGLTLARFLMTGAFGCKIVGDAKKRRLRSTVFSGVVSKHHARRFNAELLSQIEFLTPRGWLR